MPPRKRQRTSNDSAGASEEDPIIVISPSNSPSPSPTPDALKRDFKSIPPFEFICINRPLFDFEREHIARNKAGEDRIDDEGEERPYAKYIKAIEDTKNEKLYPWPATDRPGWIWISQWKGIQMMLEWRRRATFVDPDNFGMYIYNDWRGYGLLELTENLLIEFNKHIVKKNHEESLQQMWATTSALGFWLNEDGTGWSTIDDGDRCCDIYGMIGCVILSALNALDVAGELKPDSKFPNIALIISLFLTFGEGMEDYGIEEDGKWSEEAPKGEAKDADDWDWRKRVVAYAKKANIDPEQGAFETAKLLEKFDAEADTKTPKQGRWRWTARWKSYKQRHHPTVGGHHYDITKMSRGERAAAAFDGRDPLADISTSDIRAGHIMLG